MGSEDSDQNNDGDGLREPTDPAVEAALIENHRDFLRYLTRRLGRREAAEDVLQEFYVRAISRAHDLRSSESVVAWLYRVLRSALADHLRRETVRRRKEADYARALPLTSEEADDDLLSTVCTCFYKLLPTLQPDYAEMIWRIDLLAQPRQEVARMLGMTANNVSVRLHRARQALKRALLLSCQTCPEHGFLDCECETRVGRTPVRRPI